jgi:hypothetical protein
VQQDLRFIGKTLHGVYDEDDCEGVDPVVIDQLYGTHGTRIVRREGQTGAGHPDDDIEDEDVSDSSSDDESSVDLTETMGEFAARIAAEVRKNVRHEPVRVARHSSPFPTEKVHVLFCETLERVREEGIVPINYGICEDEWEDGYPPYEILGIGKRAQGQLRISLPDDVWRPKALLWCQALDVLTRIQAVMDM